jgi:hypothetical protein
MAFVNEYVAVEDYKYIPYPAGDRPKWTVDRERNIYFMILPRYGPPDFPDNWSECLLSIDGKQFVVRLKTGGAGTSEKLTDNPFYRVWCIKNPEKYESSVLDILKEALTTYGFTGAYKQIPHMVVKFTF